MKKGTIIAALLLSGCAGLHPPANMSIHDALEASTACRQINAIHYSTPFDLFGVGLIYSGVRDTLVEVQDSDCLKWLGFNRETRQ